MLVRLTAGRVPFHWIVVAVTFVVMIAAAGVRSVPGVLMVPLEIDPQLQWSRASTSLAVSINILLFGLCGPFAAAVMERIGMRRMMVGSLATLGLAVALTSRMTELWQLQLLWGVVVGLGSGAMAGWVAASIANRWFVERRGLVVGILTAANATGQLIFLPILASLVVSVGWRSSVLLVAAVSLLAIPLVVLVIRNFPQDVGLRPYGAPADVSATVRPPRPTGNPFVRAVQTLGRGVRDKDFLLLAGSFFICGASTNGLIGTHLIPASIDHHIPEVQAASFLALIGIFDVIGTMASGWLSDRFDSRMLLAWYYGLRGLSLLFLPYAYDTGYFGLALFVVFYGLDWVATVPPTVRLTADNFGKQNVGTVFAWISASHQLGAAAIALGAGAMRTWFGDYQLAFMTSGLLCLIAAGLVVRIGRPSESRSIVPEAAAA
jgi:sugar phosphate permease